MLTVDWQRFGQSVHAHVRAAGIKVVSLPSIIGISRPTIYRAFAGKPLQVDQFLTLCDWMQQDPMHFTHHPSKGR